MKKMYIYVAIIIGLILIAFISLKIIKRKKYEIYNLGNTR